MDSIGLDNRRDLNMYTDFSIENRGFPIIEGSGGHVPDLLTNDKIFKIAQPLKPNGSPVSPDWMRRNFGIETHSFDYDIELEGKKSPSEGGVYDNDLAVNAGLHAISSAGGNTDEIGTLIHVSATPGRIHFQSHMPDLICRLGLSMDVHSVHLNLGCAALPAAFYEVQANLLRNPHKRVLLVASQCTSAVAHNSGVLKRYIDSSEPWAWLGFAVFSDGGGALLFRQGYPDESRGVIRSWYESKMDAVLVEHVAGGSDEPATEKNLDKLIYRMNPRVVAANFPTIIHKLHHRLRNDWAEHIEPIVKIPWSPDAVRRYYLHQANLRMIEKSIDLAELPVDRVPVNVNKYGNTSSPSTMLLIDEDLRNGLLRQGDIVVFYVVGAGNGAQYGYSLVVI